MKTVMVIDSALNCAYDCFSVNDQFFLDLFPGDGQDIEFIEDVWERGNNSQLSEWFKEMWDSPVERSKVRGIDGILFFDLPQKKIFYPNKRQSELNSSTIRSILSMPDAE